MVSLWYFGFIFMPFCMSVVLYFLLSAAVLNFDAEVSKTISLGQFKAMACNDAAKAESKLVSKEKEDGCEMVVPFFAKVSLPRSSTSTPKQSRASGSTPRSAQSSVRGTFVKSKNGFSKYGRHPPQSSSSSLTKLSPNQPSSCMTKEPIYSESCALKMSPKIDAPVASFGRCAAADDAAGFSHLFAGSFMSVL